MRYTPLEAGWEQKLRDDLRSTIKSVLSSTHSDDELPWPYNTFDLRAQRRTGSLVPAADSLASVVKGVQLVQHSISPALGPQGRSVSIKLENSHLQASFRGGYKIAQNLRSDDPLEQQGVEQMKRLAAEMYSTVGDATKTAMLLCAAMVECGAQALREGCTPKALVAGMQRAIETAITYVMTEAKNVDVDQIKAVAKTAAGFDESAAALVIEALKRVGKDGVVDVIDGTGSEAQLEIREGMQFENGFLSQSFITDSQRQQCVLTDSLLLMYEGQIGSMQAVLPVMELAVRAQKPLTVIATDIAQEALATLILNSEKGMLPAVAVKAPGQGDRRRAILEDIAVLTGGKAFLQERMAPLEEATLKDLGQAERVIVTQFDTTIIGGKGNTTDIEARISALRTRIESTVSAYDNAKLRERLARLAGAIGVIRSGGFTEDERAESRYRLESSFYSCQSAIANGCVTGGGVTYYRAKRMVEKLVSANDSERRGIEAVSQALELSLCKLIENSNIYGKSKVFDEIAGSSGLQVGFNAETEGVEDMAAVGVLDSAIAMREALTLAFAHAKGILTTGAWDAAPSAGSSSLATPGEELG